MKHKKIICFIKNKNDLDIEKIKRKFKYVELIKINKNNIKDNIKNDNIYFISKNIDEELKKQLIIELLSKDKLFYIELDFIDMLKIKNKIVLFKDIPTIKINKLKIKIGKRFIKRLFDIFFSILAIIVFIPFFIIVPVLIKLDSKGPIIYKQKRLTINNKEFTIYKFRSMIKDAELKSGPVFAYKSDPRITKIGRILRKYKIDELPQFFNVLIGDMSIVGPRPERKYFMDLLENEIPEYKLRLKFKAGITCYAHVFGNYHTSFKKRIEYDILYMNNWNIFKDFELIILTIKKVILGSEK